MATAAEAKELRRVTLDVAYRAVTSGRRVRLAAGITIPHDLLRELQACGDEDR